jgi:hypothetical protein
MKIVQTIGFNTQTGWPTPFYYRRDRDGVHVRSAIGQQIVFSVSNDEWQAILEEVASGNDDLFGVTGTSRSSFPGPKLYEIISNCLRDGGTNDRKLAYISAILVHEGTLHTFHGQVPGGLEARVYLKRSSERE